MEPVLVQHIVKKRGICGGKACVAGTRIRVQDVYVWHELRGQSVDAIVVEFPQLNKAEVYAALAYFWDHREEILKQMADEDALVREIKARTPSKLQQKSAAKDADGGPQASG